MAPCLYSSSPFLLGLISTNNRNCSCICLVYRHNEDPSKVQIHMLHLKFQQAQYTQIEVLFNAVIQYSTHCYRDISLYQQRYAMVSVDYFNEDPVTLYHNLQCKSHKLCRQTQVRIICHISATAVLTLVTALWIDSSVT